MGKFGKKHSIDTNPLSYSICVLGESGIGKTTLCYQVCEKLVGDNGYIHLDLGLERGSDAIEGIVSEKVPDYDKLIEVVDDIVENKTTDYPELQVVIWDTLDQLIPLLENKIVKDWNRKNPDKKADSILGTHGGFMRGNDKAIELFLNAMDRLEKVGVHSIIIGHVKRSDTVDPISQETFSKLTSDLSQRYFNCIKNKMDLVALAYIDRTIVAEKTGRKDIKKNDIMINVVTSEARVISFRDNSYATDCKSRFSDIVDKISLDSDAFIKAMQDAIVNEKSKSGKSDAEIKKEQKARDKAAAEAAIEYSKSAKSNKIDIDRNEDIIAEIKTKFTEASDTIQAAVKIQMQKVGLSNFKDVEVPTEALESVLAVLA